MAGKTCLFVLTDEEARNEGKLVNWVKDKIPAIKKTGNRFRDDELSLQRDAFARVCDKLWCNPDLVLQYDNWVDRKVMELKSRGLGDVFECNISTLKSVPEDWMASFFADNHEFNLKQLKIACTSDPDTMIQLVIYGLVASLALRLPESCKSKDVCRDVLKFLITDRCPTRFRDMLKNKDVFLKPSTRTVNWQLFSVYFVNFADDGSRAVSLTHKPSGCSAEFPAHIVITKDFQLEATWSDYPAALVLKPACYLCIDLFKDKSFAQPVLTGKSSLVERIAQDVSTDIKRKIALGPEAPPSKKFREDEKEESKRTSMVQARDALQKKKHDLNSRRLVRLNSDGGAGPSSGSAARQDVK